MGKKGWIALIVVIVLVLMFGGYAVGKGFGAFLIGGWEVFKGLRDGVKSSGVGQTLQLTFMWVGVLLRV